MRMRRTVDASSDSYKMFQYSAKASQKLVVEVLMSDCAYLSCNACALAYEPQQDLLCANEVVA